MSEDKVDWLSLASFSSFPSAVSKGLELSQDKGEEVKRNKKRKKKSKSIKKHKKKTKDRVDSDFSSSDSDVNCEDADLARAIDSTYQEIIHLPNGNTIIKEKKISEGDVSWKIDKQKEKEFNQHDIPRYRLDTFGAGKSESKPLSRYYDNEPSKTVRSKKPLEILLKNRIEKDKLNPFNYILYSTSIISNINDRIDYLHKIMETVFMDTTNMSKAVLYSEIVNATWNKSNQTFETMDRLVQKALSAHSLSYDLYTTHFRILRSFFLSNNHCIEDIKKNYRHFANILLDSIDTNRSLSHSPSSVRARYKESVLIDFYVTNHSSILYNLSSTEHVVAYVQGMLEYNLFAPPGGTDNESLQILEEYWDSEYHRVGETGENGASIISWLQNGKTEYAPGTNFDYCELMKVRDNVVSAVNVKCPLSMFSVVSDLNGINGNLTKQHRQREDDEGEQEEEVQVKEQEDEDGQSTMEYKLEYSALHQRRIKVPVKSDSSTTYRQLLSRRDGGAACSKSAKRSSHYTIQSPSNIQISVKNMTNFKCWQKFVANSMVCYQPLRIRDHLSEYDDDFLQHTVIFDDIKSSLFLVQEGDSRMRLVLRSLQALGVCATYSEDSNTMYHVHASNMNCSSDYILNNWIAAIESCIYHNNHTGTTTFSDFSKYACIDEILSHRLLLAPIMVSPKLKVQYNACSDGTNVPQLIFIQRLLVGIVESPRLVYDAKVELLSCALHLNSEIYLLARCNAATDAGLHEELLRVNDEVVIRKMEVLQANNRVDLTVWYHRILCAIQRGDDGAVSTFFDELLYKIASEYVTAKDFSEILQLRGAIKLYDLAMYWVGTRPVKQETKCNVIVKLGNILIDGGGDYNDRYLSSFEEDCDDDDDDDDESIPTSFAVDKFNRFKQSIDEEINKCKRKLYEAKAEQTDSVVQQMPPIVTKVDATLDVYYAVNCFIKYFFYGNYSSNLSSYALAVQQIELTDKMYRAYVYSLINLFLTKSDATGSNLHEISALQGSTKSQIEVSLLVTIERLFHARILFLTHIRSLLCPFIPDIVAGRAVFTSILDALQHFPLSTVFLSLKHHEECRQKSFKYNVRLHSTATYVPASAALLVHKLMIKLWSVAGGEKLLRNDTVDHTLFATWSSESIEDLRNTIENMLRTEAAKQIPVIWILYLTLEVGIGNYKDARHVYYRALQSVAWSKNIWLFLYCINRYNIFTEKEVDEFMRIMKVRGI